jgi:baculoviral IAP repeat-containing protein 7/8
LSQRLKSFQTWPKSIPKRPQELSEAGFFYSGSSDLTTCFACGTGVVNWEASDNVWIEHKKHAEECIFLKLNHETVTLNERAQSKITELPKIEACEQETGSESLSEQFESHCKICLERRSSVIFMPCRHVAVCGECVFGLDETCPICRTPIGEKINLFFA